MTLADIFEFQYEIKINVINNDNNNSKLVVGDDLNQRVFEWGPMSNLPLVCVFERTPRLLIRLCANSCFMIIVSIKFKQASY